MQVFHTCHIIISCKCTLWSYSTYLLYFTQQKEIGTGANSTVCMVDTNRLNFKTGMVTKCYIGSHIKVFVCIITCSTYYRYSAIKYLNMEALFSMLL